MIVPCLHESFGAYVNVDRIIEGDEVEQQGYSASIKIYCMMCDEPFIFHGVGLPVGITPDRPSISVDGVELRVPLRPSSSDPASGLGLLGQVMRMTLGDPVNLN